MVLEIFSVEPVYPQYSGVLETCLALRYWFFDVLGSESVKIKKMTIPLFSYQYAPYRIFHHEKDHVQKGLCTGQNISIKRMVKV